MSRRITLREPLAPTAPPVAGRPFALRYVAANDSGEVTAGHWDYLAILDAGGEVRFEDWHQNEPLGPYDHYEAVIEVDALLSAGSYAASLTLDGSAEGAETETEPFTVAHELAG